MGTSEYYELKGVMYVRQKYLPVLVCLYFYKYPLSIWCK